MLKESEFINLADRVIKDIWDVIETQDKDCILDMDFAGEILNIVTPKGQYVINRHTAAREIWLASPISGPKHFAYNINEKNWVSKSGENLVKILQQELRNFISNLNLEDIIK